jgi:DNA-binding MarR family transcriptional regulator
MSHQILTTQVSSPALEAWVRLLRSSVAATRALSADLQSEHGLTINDYEALLLLSHAEENALKRIELAEGLLLTPSGVTRLLDGLELAGWVKKGTCESDARVTYAILTDAGREKLEQAGRSHVAAVRALFEAHLDNEELGTLAELLGRLPGAAGADAADCAA